MIMKCNIAAQRIEHPVSKQTELKIKIYLIEFKVVLESEIWFFIKT